MLQTKVTSMTRRFGDKRVYVLLNRIIVQRPIQNVNNSRTAAGYIGGQTN
ncbi:hypothetical protein [Paenibacillus periandrae]|nr:hypothetical protein [Paenibacillus periandrae]